MNKQQKKKLIKCIVGFSLILIGIAGLFLPILQGIILIVLGIVVLKSEELKDVWGKFKEMAFKFSWWKRLKRK